MASSSWPIGVFDSGVGGLSVLVELRRRLPREHFVYLGDVARLPYGTKSAGVVTRYARHCVEFLRRQPVKAAVIACNTASAMALEALQAECDIPVLGVITPGARAGLAATRAGKILVLATASAVKSEAYPRAFAASGMAEGITQLACPLLVPLAEEGWFDHPLTAEVIRRYLDRVDADYDTIVLGCTHYPLLEPSFRRVLDARVALVHGGGQLAAELEATLRMRHLTGTGSKPGSLRFLATDRIAPDLPLLEALFRNRVVFETVDL